MPRSDARALHVRYEGKVAVPELGEQVCYKLVRKPYDPPEDLLKRYYPDNYAGPIRPRQTAEQLSKAKLVPPKLLLDADDRAYLEALYDAEVSYQAILAGARGYLLKNVTSASLLAAIEALAAGGTYFQPAFGQTARQRLAIPIRS